VHAQSHKAGRGLTLASAAFLLAGCVGTIPAPKVFEVKDQAAFETDFTLCKGYAAKAGRGLSIGDISTAGAKAGLENAPGAAVNLGVPAIAALGGAASETLTELNVLGQTQRRLTVHCMERKGDKSGAYFVLDPNY
jgi:hypothetical protein